MGWLCMLCYVFYRWLALLSFVLLSFCVYIVYGYAEFCFAIFMWLTCLLGFVMLFLNGWLDCAMWTPVMG